MLTKLFFPTSFVRKNLLLKYLNNKFFSIYNYLFRFFCLFGFQWTFLQAFACMVGPSGLEPPTSCLSGTRSNLLSYEPMWLVWLFTLGFCRRKEACASFVDVGIELSSRTVSRKVFSPLQSLTSVFGMGTGGPSALITPTIFLSLTMNAHWKPNKRSATQQSVYL